MNEYNISFTAPHNGSILLDIHGSTGTSRYVTFRAAKDLEAFLRSLGLNKEKVEEVEAICANLRAGEACHTKMFLPEAVIEAVGKLTAKTGETVNVLSLAS